ncbi:hypothetical protein [Actinocrispum wychmicini]|uniref:Uncharacterized protein n=1 Tax=Actinocrispum wychmicini TaxID=1213861 RepID=A0A4R2IW57_9PSEU|nr:hypothetical protein [Actinocrispum wychmicini]TCO49644.1 hypothetical protein EV192_1149 [Actinocrispum wychmicini]
MTNKDTNKEINKELLALTVIACVVRLLERTSRRLAAASDRGAQSVDVAVWIGLLIIAAVAILWPQIQHLLQGLMAKWQS